MNDLVTQSQDNETDYQHRDGFVNPVLRCTKHDSGISPGNAEVGNMARRSGSDR